MIKRVEVRLANLASEAQLVRACAVGNNVGHVEGKVTATFRIRDAGLLESTNPYVRSSDNGFTMIGCVGAEEQAYVCWNEAVIEIVEQLIEIICPG